MKRYIRSTSSTDVETRAKDKFYGRIEYEQRMKGLGNQIEDMLRKETEAYLQEYPEYREWWDDAADCKVVPDRSARFYPSNELRAFAKENGFKLTRAASKYVPDYDWYVTPV